ncbi:MAG: IS66 family insertion sequence element accessory protein TnpA [Acetatifactor sp.]
MNAKQKLHQFKLNEWAVRCADQKASGLPVKVWCQQNNISIHTYNYWKHLLKQDAVDQLLPDIVPLSFPTVPTVSEVESQTPSSVNSNRSIRSTARLTLGDISIEVDDYASEAFLSALIKAVRHA